MNRDTVVRPEPYWLIAAALVLGDQLTKFIALQMNTPIDVLGISIGPVVNTEGIFGLDLSNTALIGLGLIICIGLLVLVSVSIKRPPARLGCWLILGGAFSNTLDRVIHGGVVDIISIGGTSRFNLADVMILLGALALLRSIWWKDDGGGRGL